MANNQDPSPHTRFLDAESAKAAWYWFLGSGVATTITGFWLNSQGERTGNSFSTAVNAAGGAPVRLQSTPPGDAVGAIVVFSAKTFFDVHRSETPSSDFTANYANYPSYSSTDGNVPVGRVNVS